MTDAAEPPRKRRRPALSCLECRRRKIKCDRVRPCGPCTHSKSPSCTFASDPPAPAPIWPPTTTTTLPTSLLTARPYATPSQDSRGQSTSRPSTTNAPTPTQQSVHSERTALDISSEHFPTPGPSPATSISRSGGQIQSSWWSHPSFQEQRGDQTIDDLRLRIKDLEKKLTTSEFPQATKADTELTSESKVPPFEGTLAKSRYFGPSHWTCYFEQVSSIQYKFKC